MSRWRRTCRPSGRAAAPCSTAGPPKRHRRPPRPANSSACSGSGSPELVAYQDESYAAAYAEFVEGVRAAEDRAVPGSTQLSEAVARYLYKLMAYKDEYEVARLCLDPAVEAGVAETFGPGSRISYRLHPPALRALGMQRKIALGRWARPAFRALRAMRRLRGTRLDPFGRAHVRRVERALIGEYRAATEAAIELLGPATHETAVRLAELPDLVRGYEDVKLRNVERFRAAKGEILGELPAAGVRS